MKTFRRQQVQRLRGFTLVELLVVVLIMGILASMALMALAGATEQARVDKTNSDITKLDTMIMERYEGYRVRPLPIRLNQATRPLKAQSRLAVVWETMRMELPERITDIYDDPTVLPAVPALCKQYRKRAEALCGATKADYSAWTRAHQGAECLYLIVASMHDDEGAMIEHFSSNQIGDVDGDKMPEILDAWGNPIAFLRWAPGFVSQRQLCDATTQPDPFDPTRQFPANFALTPLIFSPGPDKEYEIATDVVSTDPNYPFSYANQSPANNPYATVTGTPFGSWADSANGVSDGNHGEIDNITNHFNIVR